MTAAKRIAWRLVLLVACFATGCFRPSGGDARTPIDLRREAGRASDDGEAVGRWLLAELVAPGGSIDEAKRAREKLAAIPSRGLFASLARAIDGDVHGRLSDAAEHYLAALEAARTSTRSDAPLFGWFVASRLQGLRPAVADLWQRGGETIARAVAQPMALGWRARSVLVELEASERRRQGASAMSRDERIEAAARAYGCVGGAQFAGPFGSGTPGDHRVRFAAERPAPWPARFDEGENRHRPEIVPAEQHGCALYVERILPDGVYYVQTFIELDTARELVVAVAGASSLSVDDVEVLRRDEASWASWVRFGVRLRLEAGRHRLLARLGQPETSIRVLAPDGSPANVRASADAAAPYHLGRPQVLASPDPLEPFLRALGVEPPPRAASPEAVDVRDPLTRYVAGVLAHDEGYHDVASVLFEPLVEDMQAATPVALAQAALAIEEDPIFTPATARTLARDMKRQAAEADEELWGPRLWLALEGAAKARPADVAAELEAMVERFAQVPMVLRQLAAVYGQLGWAVEHARTAALMAERFPDDVAALEALLEVYERQGKLSEADALVERIRQLEPGSEVELRRVLRRRDFKAAIREVERIAEATGDHRGVAMRVADLLTRAGEQPATSRERLELALEQNPRDAGARLALADARYAAGERRALEEALVDAIRTGARSDDLRVAIDLVEGATSLEPYRRDGLAIIRETEQKQISLPGSAARVLDYAALWVDEDGSARMLEHTILRVQSREGIAKHTEQRMPQGILLTMRTVKKDGRILEPEIIAGKPTITMPHLEVGDYIESESIWILPGEGDGRRFRAPRWYFREPNVSYHLSELVVISPSSRTLSIETHGDVPEPQVTRSEGLDVRRWTVTGQLGLPEEPGAPPAEEFLPSVHVGWGVDWMTQLEAVADARGGGYPADPRLARIAATIATGTLADEATRALAEVPKDERARRIYRWVVDNVRPGSERSPARIVTSKSGDLTEAFIYLCRLAGVDARLGAVRSRLAPPPRGVLSGLDPFSSTAVRVATDVGARWLLVRSRFAPYGYLPSWLSGQPAVLLDRHPLPRSPSPGPLARERTTTGGLEDGVVNRGTVALRRDGSAELTLEQEYHGRYAIVVRTALNEADAGGEDKRRNFIEQAIVGPKLPGARVADVSLPNLDALDEPLRMKLRVEVPNFAQVTDRGLAIVVPFLGSMARMVALPQRETPLYLPEGARSKVVLDIELPEGAQLASTLEELSVDDPRLRVRVADRLDQGAIHIEREADLPAGRVRPDDYPEFRELLLRADRSLNQIVRVDL